MNPALPQNLPGHSLPQGMGIGGGGGGGLGGMSMPGMGTQGDLGMGNSMGGQGAGFDLSEFPSLGGGPGGGGRSGMPGMGGGLQQFRSPQAFDLVQAANQAQEPPKPAFAIESEDFPALPGALGAPPRRSESFDGVPLSTEELASQTPVDKADRFGLMGLLSVIRMTDQDLNTLALGAPPRPAAAPPGRNPARPPPSRPPAYLPPLPSESPPHP